MPHSYLVSSGALILCLVPLMLDVLVPGVA
jgi:hypothetical protein